MKRTPTNPWTLALAGCLALAACESGAGPAGPSAGSGATPPTTGAPGNTQSDPDTGGAPDGPEGFEPQAPSLLGTTVVWKRAAVVERDLMRALQLDRQQLCNELGSISCVDAHLAPLGGNEPFELAQYKPINEPSSVSPSVLERLVMGACAKRVELDRTGTPQVFTRLPLEGAIAGSDLTHAMDAQHRDLFRRLLARDPSDDELIALRELARGDGAPNTGAELATLGCFVIGTHAEFAFL